MSCFIFKLFDNLDTNVYWKEDEACDACLLMGHNSGLGQCQMHQKKIKVFLFDCLSVEKGFPFV